jgi:hypothetical protein
MSHIPSVLNLGMRIFTAFAIGSPSTPTIVNSSVARNTSRPTRSKSWWSRPASQAASSVQLNRSFAISAMLETLIPHIFVLDISRNRPDSVAPVSSIAPKGRQSSKIRKENVP